MAPQSPPTPPSEKTPLSSILPPLIFGCGTFNYQYVSDPHSINASGLIQYALDNGIRAFDTSPYYGPSESIIGEALNTPAIREKFQRSDYFLLTKVGRIAADEFDYSPEAVRASVKRSLQRLKTEYLDVVYCHDVEFVSQDEAIAAVKELRHIRDTEGTVKYVGISGYPLRVLSSIAKRVLLETGEPLDAVMSYANFTLQNTLLASRGVKELKDAGVDVVPNASPLGMGLLRREGVPGDWHPAPSGLRAAVKKASQFCDERGEKLEDIAIRYALEGWSKAGAEVGSRVNPGTGVAWKSATNGVVREQRLGIIVMGFTRREEIEKGLRVWRSVLDSRKSEGDNAQEDERRERGRSNSISRQRTVQVLADGIREHLNWYIDYTWDSPPKGFVNKLVKVEQVTDDAALLTPGATPQAA